MKPPEWKEGTFSELRGVFVTLNLAEERPDRLRGCIGFPYPVKPLGVAIKEAAVAAASEDPASGGGGQSAVAQEPASKNLQPVGAGGCCAAMGTGGLAPARNRSLRPIAGQSRPG